MASVRSLDNALELEWIPGVSTSVAPITKDDGTTIIPDNGRIIRNLIHGADTVMSHITHFYALTALDYVDASYLGPVWDPYYTDTGTDAILPGTAIMPNGIAVVTNYVESLVMRRKCHSLSAILSGRHPHQNAIVPGGVSSLPTASDMAKFSELLDTVRTFINTAYIPDVYTVATHPAMSVHWTTGTNPRDLLAYGDFPIQTGTGTERLLLKRGLCNVDTPSITTGQPTAFLQNVHEFIGYSYYDYPLGTTSLHPSSGITTPNVSKINNGTQYSWLKAPRFGTSNTVCQVGPLPRMFASFLEGAGLGGGTGDDPVVSGAAGPNAISYQPLTLIGGLTGTYSLTGLVAGALGAVTTKLNLAVGLVPAAKLLASTLGRHACRMLECKYIADAMAETGLGAAGESWISQLTDGGRTLSSPVYVYAKLPKRIKSGAGWAEAPRGALGHWITIDKKRVASYQCVVPTTWNHSPRDDSGAKGAAEESIMNQAVGSTSDQRIINILRHLHTWDFCIACAVHVVTPDGSTIGKLKIDTDGKVTRLPNDAEI